jgi:hypothetical protein
MVRQEVFIASEDSHWISGEPIKASGGVRARLGLLWVFLNLLRQMVYFNRQS